MRKILLVRWAFVFYKKNAESFWKFPCSMTYSDRLVVWFEAETDSVIGVLRMTVGLIIFQRRTSVTVPHMLMPQLHADLRLLKYVQRSFFY